MVQIGNLKTKKYKEKSGKKEETPCVTKKRISDIYYQKFKKTRRWEKQLLNDKCLFINTERTIK